MPFIGTTPTQGFVSAVTKQSFTPNGSTTAFTLTHSVSNANDLEVFIGKHILFQMQMTLKFLSVM